ncbi:MAG: DotA/TraY family protein, partial [Alphaproteobacteria bacterium]|nr:DotA/TraY family protein [Alphaproteobacteria bacterium]
NPGSRASIAATCGEIAVPLIDARLPGSDNPPEPGPVEIQKQYLNIIYNFWNLDDYVDDYAMATVSRYTSLMGGGGDLPPPKWKIDNFMEHRGELEETFTDAKTAQENDPRWSIDPFMIKRGWAAAGVWYNKIAQLNGSMTAAAYAVPNVSRYPEVMERVLNAKKQQAEVISPDTRFEPVMPGGGREWTTDPIDRQKAKAMWEGFNYWQSDGHVSSTHTDPSGSPVGDAINALLGTEGLYDMVKNADIHPLAQLVGIGRALVESAVRNLGLSAAASVGGAIGGTLSKLVGDIGDVGIGFFMSMATLGLATGFIMFYIIPFMPFIYFFFAVGAWIKTIFEAMVGAPLWALAHIRIDGPGLPGKAAIGGYFLIFEIFLRPILIIFGLLASITIFAALISTLNEIWSMVTYNVGGFNPVENMNGNAMDYFRSPLDELFFTVVYAVIAYLMGMSSFKLIDLIPSKILRWMGRNDTIFSDNREDAGQFIGTAYVGADQAIKPIFGGLQGVMSSFGKPNRGGGAS